MSQVTIQKIEFVLPAQVTYLEEGITRTCTVHVDINSRIVHSGPPEIADQFFLFLDEDVKLPEDAYAADEETYEAAAEAIKTFQNAQNEHLRDFNA